jgi:MGT family glycosyltransferase
MRNPCIAFFSMPDPGHFRRLLPMISGLAASNVAVHVFSHQQFRTEIEEAGASFFDLFSRYPLELADPGSLPRSCRYVTYAAHYAEAVCDEVRRLRPAVIIYGTFAVIGHVVAIRLGIPYVNVCAGHNVNPVQFLRSLPSDPRVKLHPACWKAADRLRDHYGIRGASPFSFIATLSPFLNVYCEPPAFLKPLEREAFEPVAFFGSIVREGAARSSTMPRIPTTDPNGKLTVYVSFGTIVWRHHAAQALQALQAISRAFSGREDISAVISLGGHDLPRQTVAALARPNVRVEGYVDQWEMLRVTDVFITHNGLNSTHEAIFHRVPMISVPFFWDQPALARRCQEYGLAVALVDSVGESVRPEDVTSALLEVANRRDSLLENLQTAYQWERQVMADRGAVLQRVTSLEAR